MNTLQPLGKVLAAADHIEVVGVHCHLLSEPDSERVVLDQDSTGYGDGSHYFDPKQLVDITKPIMVDELYPPKGHQGRLLKEIKVYKFRPMTLDDLTA